MSGGRLRAIARFAVKGELAAHLAQPSLRAAVAKLAPTAAEPPAVQRMRAV